MIEDQVRYQADTGCAQIARQGSQLGHRPQRWMYFAVAADGVAPVALPGGHFEERHQMQVGQPQLLKVRNLRAQALQIPGEQVDVTDATQDLIRLEPERIHFPGRVQGTQISRALGPGARQTGEQIFEMEEKIVAVAV